LQSRPTTIVAPNHGSLQDDVRFKLNAMSVWVISGLTQRSKEDGYSITLSARCRNDSETFSPSAFRAKIRLCPLLSQSGQTLVRLLCSPSAKSGHPPRIGSHENRKTASRRSLRNFHHALIKRPRAQLGVCRFSLREGGLVRCLAPIESVVHADQDSGRGRFGVEGTTSGTDRDGRGGDYIAIGRAEVHVVAFQKC
jgi:hypothetical protein